MALAAAAIADVRCAVGETTMSSSDVMALTERRQRPSKVSICVNTLRFPSLDMITPLSVGAILGCRSMLPMAARPRGRGQENYAGYKVRGNLYIHALSKDR